METVKLISAVVELLTCIITLLITYIQYRSKKYKRKNNETTNKLKIKRKLMITNSYACLKKDRPFYLCNQRSNSPN
jgi:hypothetical protein